MAIKEKLSQESRIDPDRSDGHLANILDPESISEVLQVRAIPTYICYTKTRRWEASISVVAIVIHWWRTIRRLWPCWHLSSIIIFEALMRVRGDRVVLDQLVKTVLIHLERS